MSYKAGTEGLGNLPGANYTYFLFAIYYLDLGRKMKPVRNIENTIDQASSSALDCFIFGCYITMKIGLLSDTHGYLDKKIFDHFSACDEIWHAGDIGDTLVAEALAKFKPLRAVFGNIDGRDLQLKFPKDLRFDCEELDVWITHIGGVPPRYNPRVKKILKENPPDIFICGHSHILRLIKDPALDDMLYINPGAAGNQGFHHIKTLVRFDIVKREIKNVEVIEIGKRGEIAN